MAHLTGRENDVANERVGLLAMNAATGISDLKNEKYAKPDVIEERHRENRLEDNQFKTSKGLLNKMEFKVPLEKLYKVVASCNYNIANLYCPVLVEVIDKLILEKNGGMPFLIQVWDRQG